MGMALATFYSSSEFLGIMESNLCSWRDIRYSNEYIRDLPLGKIVSRAFPKEVGRAGEGKIPGNEVALYLSRRQLSR